MPLKSQRPLIASVAWGKPGVIIGVRCSTFPDRVDVYGWPIQLACSSPSLAKHVVGGVAGWRLLIPVTDWSMDMKLEDILAMRDAMPLIVFWRSCSTGRCPPPKASSDDQSQLGGRCRPCS